ncbi:MAG: hypothetical protein IKG59_03310 [Firmicutes bacterium]|nr:hypothetical protein [Bacillota bacterium]MBR3212106.1 hypothetical protein [Bacillota bacterium]
MLAKLIAKHMVKTTMLEAARDESEDTIRLTKGPGKKSTKEFMATVNFRCPLDRIPLYVERIIVSAAKATDVTFDEMIDYLKTEHELMQEITKETITKEVKRDDSNDV